MEEFKLFSKNNLKYLIYSQNYDQRIPKRQTCIANTKISKHARGKFTLENFAEVTFVHLDNFAAPDSSQPFSPGNLLRGNLHKRIRKYILGIYLLLNISFENLRNLIRLLKLIKTKLYFCQIYSQMFGTTLFCRFCL